MDSTQRFSSRVGDYRRHRPGYPPQVADDLLAQSGLPKNPVIADIGSGTGLLARLFVERGCSVVGIEPNAEMRAAGEEELRAFRNFRSLPGTAEATALPAQSVDLVTAAQAFHWFDRAKAKTEFRRILRPGSGGGRCAILWNNRLTTTSSFLVAYEQLLRDFATDYAMVDHKNITDPVLADFFAPQPVQKRIYPNKQFFDFDGLKGRLLSSSYSPPADHPSHAPMLARLAEIFQRHQQNGRVIFEYQTEVFGGVL
ncbi:MAG TPA: class I SAM-dependent methyltransferase [Phycisphaerae bacterium]|nr:class I SAM-dependent methyltransferase [Phycisphaerae bacterium]